MKRRVQANLLVASGIDGDTIAQEAATRRTTRPAYSVDCPEQVLDHPTRALAVVVSIRFQAVADATAWRDQLVDLWSSGPLRNRILAGSRVVMHDCPHDEATEAQFPCTDARAALVTTTK